MSDLLKAKISLFLLLHEKDCDSLSDEEFEIMNILSDDSEIRDELERRLR